MVWVISQHGYCFVGQKLKNVGISAVHQHIRCRASYLVMQGLDPTMETHSRTRKVLCYYTAYHLMAQLLFPVDPTVLKMVYLLVKFNNWA